MYDALRSDVGIVIASSDREHTRAQFYKLRKEDEDLSVLSLKMSPTNSNELWIVKSHEREPD